MVRRRTHLAVALVAGLLLLSGCGTSSPTSVPPPSPTSPTYAAATLTPETPTAPTPSATVSASSVPCPTVGRAPIPTGTWHGALRIDLTGRGAGATYDTTQDTGTLRLTIANGRVTAGRWSVGWHSQGHAHTGTASATIVLRGTLNGTVSGSATTPVLSGIWAIHGTATITRPVRTSAPVDETGRTSDPLRITSTSCDRITGTFAPSFTSKDARATFRGTARWVAVQD
ncbi:MAG: hypothetical protein JWR52_799 [Marmoricola sp.]|nr:hypothetical protein [Marmoricola sp.]